MRGHERILTNAIKIDTPVNYNPDNKYQVKHNFNSSLAFQVSSLVFKCKSLIL